jgi:hypothetical protein
MTELAILTMSLAMPTCLCGTLYGHVTNCFIAGTGNAAAIVITAGNGDLLKNNQICECGLGIFSVSNRGCAIVHNYVANSDSGPVLGDHDCYQGNVVTNCKTPFQGGHAIGGENGSD